MYGRGKKEGEKGRPKLMHDSVALFSNYIIAFECETVDWLLSAIMGTHAFHQGPSQRAVRTRSYCPPRKQGAFDSTFLQKTQKRQKRQLHVLSV